MKRVLVPIDFSDNSVFALKIGLELSNHLHASLRMIHVQTGQKYAPEFLGDNPEERLIGQAKAWLEHLLRNTGRSIAFIMGNLTIKSGKVMWSGKSPIKPDMMM